MIIRLRNAIAQTFYVEYRSEQGLPTQPASTGISTTNQQTYALNVHFHAQAF